MLLSFILLPLFPLLAFAQDEPKYYNLKSKDNFLSAYHTGAGLNDAAIVSDKGIKGYLNDTKQMFDLGTEFPWGMTMTYGPYQGWSSVQINAGEGDAGFSLDDDNNLQWDNDGFGGWLVCDWWHGSWQLFWINSYYNITVPDCCYESVLTANYI